MVPLQEITVKHEGFFGDWNANMKDPDNYLFASHMLSCEDNNICLSTCSSLPSDSYSYIQVSILLLAVLRTAISV